MLTFLFAMINYSIGKYQNNQKVMVSFNRKVAQSIYYFLNLNLFDALNDKYIYMDNQILIYILAQIKKSNPFKIQVASYACSKYKTERYPRANKASV